MQMKLCVALKRSAAEHRQRLPTGSKMAAVAKDKPHLNAPLLMNIQACVGLHAWWSGVPTQGA